MRPRPAVRSRSSISTATTSRPPRANTSAMPAPMVPRPTTPTVEICTGQVCRTRFCQLPETGCIRLESAKLVVVEHDAVDPAGRGEHACLRLDLLCGEDAAHRPQRGVA